MASKVEIDELIESVNSASDHARTLVAGMLLTALIMAAMVVGTSDQAILLNSIEVAPTLGVRVTVSVAHLFAPIILLFFHVGALIQLDLTDARWHRLSELLRSSNLDPATRAHHHVRVHSTVDTQALRRDAGRGRGRAVRRAVAWVSVVWIPLLVLLALQISFVRYQSDAITRAQAAVFIIDAAALIWFFRQLRRRRDDALRCHFGLAVMAVFLSLGLLNAHPPGADEMARDVRWIESNTYTRATNKDTTPQQWDNSFPDGACSVGDRDERGYAITPTWLDLYVWPAVKGCNLLDVYFCPYAKWGCRYLRLSNTTQVAGPLTTDLITAANALNKPLQEFPNPKKHLDCEPLMISDPDRIREHFAPPKEKETEAEKDKRLKAEAKAEETSRLYATQIRAAGLRLRERSFRFADFKDVVFYGADLVNSELQGANMEEIKLQWAWLDGAKLNGAMLDDAALQNASLERVDMRDASLRDAGLQGVLLTDAQFAGAILNRADLTDAELPGADLSGAQVRRASFVDADMQGVTLAGADLRCAALIHVDLRGASLCGADVSRVTGQELSLQGAWLADMLTKDTSFDKSTMDAATFSYLALTEDRLPGIAFELVDPHTHHVQLDAEQITDRLTKLACEDSRIGAGMVDWLVPAQGTHSIKVNAIRRDATKAVLDSFGIAIKEHNEAVRLHRDFECPGLADLYLTETQRAAMGLD